MKYALFTGATGGLGTLCVRALSETGNWTVFAAGTNAAKLAQLGRLRNVVPVHMDVADRESIDEAHEAVAARTDRLDAVCNFAGLAAFTSLAEGDGAEAVEKLLRINVMGTVRVNQAFFDMVLKGRGRIVNCSSEAGWMTPQPFIGPYAISKYAVEGYNDSLRRELMYLGIPVIKIQPGSFETALTGQIYGGFDKTVSETKYYKKLLEKMKPLMAMELGQKNDPRRLVKTVLRAMEARRPKLRYRVGTGRLLFLLELLPEKGVDVIYKLFYGKRGT